MASSATAFQPSVFTASRAPRTARRFSFSDLLDVLAKSLTMAQALPDTGRPSARQIDAVRKIADSI